MKSILFFLSIILVVGCQDQKNHFSKIIRPEFAKHFFFAVNENDTTLNIINGSDTISISNQSEISFHLLSTTQVGYFDLIKHWTSIKGVVFPNELNSPEIQSRLNKGQIVHLNPNNGEVDQELLWTNKASYLLYSPFDPITYALPEGTTKLPFLDYVESHPLGKLEWIKVIGFLINQSAKATALFDEKKSRYLSMVSQKTRNQTAVIGSWDGEYFYVNSDQSTIHQCLKDAGYSSIGSKTSGNVQWDKEQLWSKLPNIDHLIWITTSSQKQLLEKEMQQPESWQKKWGLTPHFIIVDTCSYFENSAIFPEKLLYDFVELNQNTVKTYVTN